MSHFAHTDKDGIVDRVIVAEQDFIGSGAVGKPSEWVQTSYNTHGGVHELGGTPMRKNYAGIGYTYDKKRDAFVPPQPFPSWTLNEDSCTWQPPVAEPADGKYSWNEHGQKWDVTYLFKKGV